LWRGRLRFCNRPKSVRRLPRNAAARCLARGLSLLATPTNLRCPTRREPRCAVVERYRAHVIPSESPDKRYADRRSRDTAVVFARTLDRSGPWHPTVAAPGDDLRDGFLVRAGGGGLRRGPLGNAAAVAALPVLCVRGDGTLRLPRIVFHRAARP